MADIASFIEGGIKEPAIIFGHSFGGMIGIMLAAYHPELVKALIIGDSALSIEYLKEFSAKHKDKTIWWRELAKTKNVDYIKSELKKELIPVPNQKELVPAYKVLGEDNPHFQFTAECFSQTDPDSLTAIIDRFDNTYAEYNTHLLFPKIQCPTLILQANPELGGLMRDEDVEAAKSLLPFAKHVKFSNAGHWFHVQDKESTAKAVLELLEALS